MQWSKIRSRLQSNLAPEVRGRVDFHLTNYRKHTRHTHELWISVDQERVFSASYCKNLIAEYGLARCTGLTAYGGTREAKAATDILSKRGIHDAADVVSSIRTYLDLHPQIALTSSDPILRGLAMLDKRIGKRTLKDLEVEDDEHPLVQRLYRVRVESLEQ